MLKLLLHLVHSFIIVSNLLFHCDIFKVDEHKKIKTKRKAVIRGEFISKTK